LPAGALAQGLDLLLVELLVGLPLIGALVIGERPVLLLLAARLRREYEARQRKQRHDPSRTAGSALRGLSDLLGLLHDSLPILI
jgi:hypothetical protein